MDIFPFAELSREFEIFWSLYLMGQIQIVDQNLEIFRTDWRLDLATELEVPDVMLCQILDGLSGALVKFREIEGFR